MKIEFDFLGGTQRAKFINEMMHSFDLFSAGKQFVSYEKGSIIAMGDPDLNKFCENMAMATEKAGGYAVFIAIRKVDGKRVNLPHWWMKSIHSVSMDQGDGLQWGLFKDIPEQLDYTVEVDEQMNVVSVL